MAVPHVDGDRPGKRWGTEVDFDELDAIVSDQDRLNQYREKVERAGRTAAARLRSAADQ